MPIYVFRCDPCRYVTEELRPLADYRPPRCRGCGRKTRRSATAPNMHVWNTERRFPNVASAGDGTMSFSSKRKYEQHLTEHHMAETAHDGKVRTPHGAKVTRYGC